MQHMLWSLMLTSIVFSLAGCGGPKLIPVSGKVYVNGEPIARGTVRFMPDAEKGNPSGAEPIGGIQPDGTYSLITHNSSGAPPGAYKVLVFYDQSTKSIYDVAESLLPPKYKDPRATPLAVEVVEKPQPGAFDLQIQADPRQVKAQRSLPMQTK